MLPLKILWWRSLSGIIADHEGGVWAIDLVGTITNDKEHPELELNRFVPINDDNPIIELVSNTDIAIRQLHRIGRQRSRIAARLRIGEVLEDDVLARIDLDNPTVVGIGDQGIPIGKPAGKGGPAQPLAILPHDLMIAISPR